MDYAELYLWDIPVVWSKPESGDRELISLRDRTPRIAAEGCDIEALIHSEMGRQMVLQFEDYIRYGDEMDPAYVQKWHAQGLDKQVMERNDFYHRWALFTPVSAREKSSRRYPLLFVLHGSSMPINWEECSGFLPIAAREELIVCIPQDHSLQNLLRLYDILTRDYPVDPGRVYCTGYSQGSAQTNALLFARPELLAAAAPCGCLAGPFSMGMEPEERVQHAAQVRVPILTVCGQQEGLYLVPYYEDAPQRGMYGARRTNPHGRETARNRLPVQAPNAAYKVESLNLRLRSCNCPRGHARGGPRLCGERGYRLPPHRHAVLQNRGTAHLRLRPLYRHGDGPLRRRHAADRLRGQFPALACSVHGGARVGIPAPLFARYADRRSAG